MALKSALCPIFLAVAVSQPLLAQETPKAPFTLQITGHVQAEHSQYWDFANTGEMVLKARNAVVIAVQKTDVSGREIPKISKWGNYYVGCEYDIRDSSGHPVKELPPRTVGSFVGRRRGDPEPVLQPGESDVSDVRLDERYDLSQPGTYTIQAWAHAWDDPNSPIVKSNILTLIIQPASAPPSQ